MAQPTITPWPLPPAATSVIIVGGSFDPPHRAHTAIPEQVRRARAAHHAAPWLLYVPAAASPFKAAAPPTAPHHRLAMLRLAISPLPAAAVWTDELDRAAPLSPSYTIDTLRRARGIAPHASLHLLIGADQAVQFHKWRDYHAILQLAQPIVLLRPPVPTAAALRSALAATLAWTDAELDRWAGTYTATADVMDASATAIRAAITAGTSPRDIPALDPAVASYIIVHHLYAAETPDAV